MILEYSIDKASKWKNIEENSIIGIKYEPQTDEEKRMNSYELALKKQQWVATQLNISPLYVIPVKRS